MVSNRSRVGLALTAIFCGLLIATAVAEKSSHAADDKAAVDINPSHTSAGAAEANDDTDADNEIRGAGKVDPQAPGSVFVPTYEFQKIPPGASVPEGLYIRMNLQTGEKEARKLLPSEIKGVNRDKYLSPSSKTNAGTGTSVETPESSSSSSLTECTEGTENKRDGECTLRAEEGGSTNGGGQKLALLGAPPSDADAVKRKERKEKVERAMEFKKAEFWAKKYQEVFHPEDDAKLIKAILIDVREWMREGWNGTELAQISQRLADLEDLSHQIDNAVDMTSMGGLAVISELLSRDSEPQYVGVQSLGLWVAGTAVQNNDKVKEAALAADLIHAALLHLRSNSSIVNTTTAPTTTTTTTTAASSSGPSSPSSLRSVAYLRKKALYFLSAVLDSNLDAQKVFWDIGGPATVVRAWAEGIQAASSSSALHPLGSDKENLGLARKAVGLVHRTMSGYRADPERFLHGLIRVWLGIPELCDLLASTLHAALKDERLAEDALELLALLLDDEFAKEPPSAACTAFLSASSSSSSSSSSRSLIDSLTALDAAFGRDEGMQGGVSAIGTLVASLKKKLLLLPTK